MPVISENADEAGVQVNKAGSGKTGGAAQNKLSFETEPEPQIL
ncbi:hypothetical protein [Salibacterium qingdaonense]|uniref:Uncharacterized protein n=1 Tax=Salibacterium qingdaonense TaxID=266892 RepID=A0A1I4LP23_9BACI|nr:hypothetical protein [Salibacterium qingdaonense]SFL92754.1 hypothetical protein SAMN04488054_10883 [Salibacterium qingdaonense]